LALPAKPPAQKDSQETGMAHAAAPPAPQGRPATAKPSGETAGDGVWAKRLLIGGGVALVGSGILVFHMLQEAEKDADVVYVVPNAPGRQP
jgi:hypothetical protein